ncbi:hypothetical protein TRIUR3_13723 [Triticum urartu]|uniref:Uncharacterized protein n=1 Tax=Triticum urartu TaxID=4572 RepID=M7ZWH1_TRIUA|nr:hypothetical protein TRIUR3_13723 [Triticum urartu]
MPHRKVEVDQEKLHEAPSPPAQIWFLYAYMVFDENPRRTGRIDLSLPFSLKKYVPSRTENHDYHHCWRKKLEQLCFYFHALWLSILGRIELNGVSKTIFDADHKILTGSMAICPMLLLTTYTRTRNPEPGRQPLRRWSWGNDSR